MERLAVELCERRGELSGNRCPAASVDAARGIGPAVERCHAEEPTHAGEQLLRMEVDVLEESDEDLVGGIVRLPDLDRPRVVRAKPRARLLEVAEEVVVIRLRRARVANLHHRVRPRPLDRVAEQEDDLRLGEQLADPGDLLRLEDRVARRHLTCAATMPRREERGVPPVVPAEEEIASEPAELREGRPVQRAPGVSPELAAPARPFDRPPEGAAHERAPGDALLVEVVQLLLGGKPHVGVLLQIPVEPGGAGLLSADADEVGSVRAHPPTVRGGARGRRPSPAASRRPGP